MILFTTYDFTKNLVVGAFFIVGEAKYHCRVCEPEVGRSPSLQEEDHHIIKNQQGQSLLF